MKACVDHGWYINRVHRDADFVLSSMSHNGTRVLDQHVLVGTASVVRVGRMFRLGSYNLPLDESTKWWSAFRRTFRLAFR